MDTQNLEERLLTAWLNMSYSIRANRIISSFSFNEIILYNILYKNYQSSSSPLTATDLCMETKLLKSQINRILTSMESKGYIRRLRSEEDKRKVYVLLNEETLNIYLSEHQKVISLMSKIQNTMGYDDMSELTVLIEKATKIISDNAEI